ncbi:hypothetical protein LWI28_005827 [Acer negundo]|uniref:Neprosin PEP catalytic domain-containing protein n=1 Tax=Acer negundo TaxID=4023 RepID=A0AAD5JCJ7_ACENE|nr:hypothetical protein LWI28_005827 [Acer negundo]
MSKVLFLLLLAVSVLSNVADGKAKDRATLSGIDWKLKLLNKPAVKSIKSEDGDIIDCVDINKQPAFDHPALRNHKIQSAILVTEGQYYCGAQGYINLRNPTVDLPDDYTTAQIWLKAGTGEIYESIEAGWMVNPKLYGDRESRLFVYWTKDSYKTTGCFDTTCAGFVLTQHKLALGVGLHPLSSSEGPQRFLPIGIYQDDTGNWWLKVGQNYEVVVGYWPKELFAYLWRSASLVEWGGEVYSQNVRNRPPHTKTQMGSGSFAQTLEGSAASIQQVRIMDSTTRKLKYPEWVGTGSDEQYCYSALNHVHGNNVEPVFYFGGPGQGPQCM